MQRRLWIVDDEPAIVRLVTLLLKEEFEISGYRTGHEVLAAITAGERFDVLLCDLVMPDLTGTELVAKMRLLEPDLGGRVVYMTAGMVGAAAESLATIGGSPMLFKPLDVAALRAVVRSLA